MVNGLGRNMSSPMAKIIIHACQNWKLLRLAIFMIVPGKNSVCLGFRCEFFRDKWKCSKRQLAKDISLRYILQVICLTLWGWLDARELLLAKFWVTIVAFVFGQLQLSRCWHFAIAVDLLRFGLANERIDFLQCLAIGPRKNWPFRTHLFLPTKFSFSFQIVSSIANKMYVKLIFGCAAH